jgi:hypothetical protein
MRAVVMVEFWPCIRIPWTKHAATRAQARHLHLVQSLPQSQQPVRGAVAGPTSTRGRFQLSRPTPGLPFPETAIPYYPKKVGTSPFQGSISVTLVKQRKTQESVSRLRSGAIPHSSDHACRVNQMLWRSGELQQLAAEAVIWLSLVVLYCKKTLACCVSHRYRSRDLGRAGQLPRPRANV